MLEMLSVLLFLYFLLEASSLVSEYGGGGLVVNGERGLRFRIGFVHKCECSLLISGSIL